jgi:hypothetical protein
VLRKEMSALRWDQHLIPGKGELGGGGGGLVPVSPPPYYRRTGTHVGEELSMPSGNFSIVSAPLCPLTSIISTTCVVVALPEAWMDHKVATYGEH